MAKLCEINFQKLSVMKIPRKNFWNCLVNVKPQTNNINRYFEDVVSQRSLGDSARPVFALFHEGPLVSTTGNPP